MTRWHGSTIGIGLAPLAPDGAGGRHGGEPHPRGERRRSPWSIGDRGHSSQTRTAGRGAARLPAAGRRPQLTSEVLRAAAQQPARGRSGGHRRIGSRAGHRRSGSQRSVTPSTDLQTPIGPMRLGRIRRRSGRALGKATGRHTGVAQAGTVTVTRPRPGRIIVDEPSGVADEDDGPAPVDELPVCRADPLGVHAAPARAGSALVNSVVQPVVGNDGCLVGDGVCGGVATRRRQREVAHAVVDLLGR
jgi:hypothetical protein